MNRSRFFSSLSIAGWILVQGLSPASLAGAELTSPSLIWYNYGEQSIQGSQSSNFNPFKGTIESIGTDCQGVYLTWEDTFGARADQVKRTVVPLRVGQELPPQQNQERSLVRSALILSAPKDLREFKGQEIGLHTNNRVVKLQDRTVVFERPLFGEKWKSVSYAFGAIDGPDGVYMRSEPWWRSTGRGLVHTYIDDLKKCTLQIRVQDARTRHEEIKELSAYVLPSHWANIDFTMIDQPQAFAGVSYFDSDGELIPEPKPFPLWYRLQTVEVSRLLSGEAVLEFSRDRVPKVK